MAGLLISDNFEGLEGKRGLIEELPDLSLVRLRKTTYMGVRIAEILCKARTLLLRPFFPSPCDKESISNIIFRNLNKISKFFNEAQIKAVLLLRPWMALLSSSYV